MIVILREQDTVFRGVTPLEDERPATVACGASGAPAMAATGRGAGFGSLSGP